MSMLIAAFAIVASLLAGYWLYIQYGSGGADATYDAVATISATFWILAGVFAIIGGFVVVGSLILVIFSYIWIAKGKKTGKRLRAVIAG